MGVRGFAKLSDVKDIAIIGLILIAVYLIYQGLIKTGQAIGETAKVVSQTPGLGKPPATVTNLIKIGEQQGIGPYANSPLPGVYPEGVKTSEQWEALWRFGLRAPFGGTSLIGFDVPVWDKKSAGAGVR